MFIYITKMLNSYLHSKLYTTIIKNLLSISGYKPMPGEELIDFSTQFSADKKSVMITRGACGESVIAHCNDFNEHQSFTFTNPQCGTFEVQCGPQTVGHYFDPQKNVPNINWDEVSNIFSQPCNKALSSINEVYNSLPNIQDFFSTPTQESKSWFDYIGEQLGLVEPEPICSWQDVSCHYEQLSAEFAKCENWSCYWETMRDYVGNFDFNEILSEIQENYLPEQGEMIKYAIGATIFAGATAFILYKRHQAAQNPSLASGSAIDTDTAQNQVETQTENKNKKGIS